MIKHYASRCFNRLAPRYMTEWETYRTPLGQFSGKIGSIVIAQRSDGHWDVIKCEYQRQADIKNQKRRFSLPRFGCIFFKLHAATGETGFYRRRTSKHLKKRISFPEAVSILQRHDRQKQVKDFVTALNISPHKNHWLTRLKTGPYVKSPKV